MIFNSVVQESGGGGVTPISGSFGNTYNYDVEYLYPKIVNGEIEYTSLIVGPSTGRVDVDDAAIGHLLFMFRNANGVPNVRSGLKNVYMGGGTLRRSSDNYIMTAYTITSNNFYIFYEYG